MINWDDVLDQCSRSKPIAAGSYGQVYRVSVLGTTFALKRSKHFAAAGSELERLMRLNHENIVTLRNHSIFNNYVFILMEYCENGNFRTFWQNPKFEYSAVTVLYFARDCMNALAYLHSKNICHRDVTPANILLTADFSAKLCDFGISKDTDHTILGSFRGTVLYMSPEMLNENKTSPKGDIFGIGLVVCELIKRKQWRPVRQPMPSLVPSLLSYYNKYANGVNIAGIRAELCDFVKGCTKFNREDRWTAADALREAEELLARPHYNELERDHGWKPREVDDTQGLRVPLGVE